MTPEISIPMSSPDITDRERQAVAAVLRTPHLSMGSEIEALEAGFCEYLSCKHAIAVNSGTAGLHLCVRAAGVHDGDLVITTPFSFVASSNAVLFERAIPVFVDVDPLTGNIDPRLVQQAAEDLANKGKSAKKWLPRQSAPAAGKLKAILPVDVFGQPADMDAIRSTADELDLMIIEDSCEALGAEYNGRKAGLLGDMGVFGFYPNKQLTTGEGGVIVTQDDETAQYMRALRNQGRAPGDTWLQHTHLGYNYRLDELSAALGRVQLSRLDEMMTKRAHVADFYMERLTHISGIECPSILPTTTRISWFVFVIRLEPWIDRELIVAELARYGIPARPYFSPIHLQPYMVEQFQYRPGDFPIAEDLGRRSLALPFSGVMEEAQVEVVCNAVRKIVKSKY